MRLAKQESSRKKNFNNENKQKLRQGQKGLVSFASKGINDHLRRLLHPTELSIIAHGNKKSFFFKEKGNVKCMVCCVLNHGPDGASSAHRICISGTKERRPLLGDQFFSRLIFQGFVAKTRKTRQKKSYCNHTPIFVAESARSGPDRGIISLFFF